MKLLLDNETIQQWDLWFDEHIPAWRTVSDEWIGKNSDKFEQVFIRYENSQEARI